jgi:hypothetical protein
MPNVRVLVLSNHKELFSQINVMNVEQGMFEHLFDTATLMIVIAQRQKVRYHWLTPIRQLRRAIG